MLKKHFVTFSSVPLLIIITDLPRLAELYQGGRLKLDELITGRYSLDQINEAIASVKRGEALRNVNVFG